MYVGFFVFISFLVGVVVVVVRSFPSHSVFCLLAMPNNNNNNNTNENKRARQPTINRFICRILCGRVVDNVVQ